MDYFTKRKLTMWVLGLLIVINITALVTIYVQSKTKIILPGITTAEKNEGYEVLNKELELSQEQAEKIREIMDEHRFAVDLIKEEIQENRLKVAEELLSEYPDTLILRNLWEKMGSLQTKLEKLNALHFMKVRASVDSVQKRKFLIVMREMQEKNKENLEKELLVIPEKVREHLRVLDTMRIIIPRIPDLPNFIPDKFDEESMKKYELKIENFGKDMDKFGKEMEKFGSEMNRLKIESIEVPHIYIDPEELRKDVIVVPEIKIPSIKVPKIITPEGEEEIDIPEIVIPEIIIQGLDPQKQEEIQKKIEEKMKEVEKKLKEKNEKLKEESEKLKEKSTEE